LRIKSKFPDQTLSIFVKPPSIKVLEERLRNRRTDSESKIQERINKAEREFKYADDFDIILVNDDLDTSKKEAYDLVKNFVINK